MKLVDEVKGGGVVRACIASALMYLAYTTGRRDTVYINHIRGIFSLLTKGWICYSRRLCRDLGWLHSWQIYATYLASESRCLGT